MRARSKALLGGPRMVRAQFTASNPSQMCKSKTKMFPQERQKLTDQMRSLFIYKLQRQTAHEWSGGHPSEWA